MAVGMRTYEPVGDEITEDLEVRLRGESAPEEDDDTVPMVQDESARCLSITHTAPAVVNTCVPFHAVYTWPRR